MSRFKKFNMHMTLAIGAVLISSMAAATPAENRLTQAPKYTDAVGKFTVQVAAYRTKDEAKEYATQLKAQGLAAFYFAVVLDHKDWYRVGIGLFSTQREAEAYRPQVVAKTEKNDAIVREIEE